MHTCFLILSSSAFNATGEKTGRKERILERNDADLFRFLKALLRVQQTTNVRLVRGGKKRFLYIKVGNSERIIALLLPNNLFSRKGCCNKDSLKILKHINKTILFVLLE